MNTKFSTIDMAAHRGHMRGLETALVVVARQVGVYRALQALTELVGAAAISDYEHLTKSRERVALAAKRKAKR
jgi:hypothetical protein